MVCPAEGRREGVKGGEWGREGGRQAKTLAAGLCQSTQGSEIRALVGEGAPPEQAF